jgi:hypothetical protein
MTRPRWSDPAEGPGCRLPSNLGVVRGIRLTRLQEPRFHTLGLGRRYREQPLTAGLGLP